MAGFPSNIKLAFAFFEVISNGILFLQGCFIDPLGELRSKLSFSLGLLRYYVRLCPLVVRELDALGFRNVCRVDRGQALLNFFAPSHMHYF